MWKYLRFGYIHWIWSSFLVTGLLAGGPWTWTGVAFLFIFGVGGEIVTKNWRDETNPEYRFPIIHDLIIYSVVACHFFVLFVALWAVSSVDLLGYGAFVNSYLSAIGIEHNVLVAKDANGLISIIGIGISLGALLGVSGTGSCHELTHRVNSPFDLWLGRWDFALSFGTNFATEHVYGHHKNLGLVGRDPVSPKRGTGFYTFLTNGQLEQWRNGFGIEKTRLEAAGKNSLSIHNRVIHAWLRGGLVISLVFLASGWIGFGIWFISALVSKYILEGLNFFSHYGLIRLDGEPITSRNTFSSCNPVGNYFTFNLGRHGTHHESAHYLITNSNGNQCLRAHTAISL
jgi:alkane 1-monooxygenase